MQQIVFYFGGEVLCLALVTEFLKTLLKWQVLGSIEVLSPAFWISCTLSRPPAYKAPLVSPARSALYH